MTVYIESILGIRTYDVLCYEQGCVCCDTILYTPCYAGQVLITPVSSMCVHAVMDKDMSAIN